MTAPQPEPVHYALTTVYTDPFLGGTDGPSMLTTDPAAAAHFFLDTDRPGHLEVMAHATGPDTTLVPVRPGEIVERALEELPPDDPRRHTLHSAQADWLENRLWDGQDEPFGTAPGGPDWTRAGAAWGGAFTTLPGADVLTELASRHPATEEAHGPLVITALRTARAIRQAHGRAGGADRQLLAANWRILNSVRPASEEPALRAAATWYLERLADLDPVTARHPDGLTDAQRARWREAAIDLQRDLLVLDSARHPARIQAFTARVSTQPADPAPDGAAHPEEERADRQRLEAALTGAFEHLPLDGAVRESVEAVAARVLKPPPLLPLPAQPAGDADAALHWRRRVPSAQRAAADADDALTQAYTYVAQAYHQTRGDALPSVAHGSTTLARTLAVETTGRHAVLGRMLVLADAERAATAHEPRLHTDAQATADAARAEAQDRGLHPMEVHYAAQVAYTATFDAGRSLLDEALTEQRLTVRATIAAHFPRPDYRLRDILVGSIDHQAVTRAHNAVTVLVGALDDLLARDRDPGEHPRPTAEQITRARSRVDAASRRLDGVIRKDRPAMVAALGALEAVMKMPAPPPQDSDGTARLTRHREQLTERLTGTVPAAGTGPQAATTPAGPRPARDLPRQATRPTTANRGMR
ncbi:hypothetical protein [Kitasatospora sp. NPDC088779]|uniref:hypothetical protein n=1 Tax=Kitasatospora sp. NPDC088779 TaxID=3154964 RepID=UPI0034434AA8